MTAARTPTRAVALAMAPPRTGMAPTVAVEALAAEAGVHPDLVRRLVRLGLIEASTGTRAEPRFPADAASRLARATRLRRDLGLNYSAAVMVCELLARIEELEARLARYEPPRRVR